MNRRTRCRATVLACFIALVLGFIVPRSLARSQDDVFAIRTALIGAVDAAGKRMEGLQRQDFEVLERGITRDVVEVVEGEPGGELYLLVDTSIAFTSHTFMLRESLRAFVEAVGSRFQVRLYEFGARPHLLAGPTGDRAELSSKIGTLIPRPEGAYLLDVLADSAREMNKTERTEEAPPVRVVIITGSGPELSNTSDQRALEAGRSAGAVFDVVLYEGAESGDFIKRAKVDGVLATLSSETGGSLKRILSVNALENTLVRLATEQLAPTYRVSFLTEMSPRTTAAELQVSVRRQGVEATVIRLLPGERRVEPDQP